MLLAFPGMIAQVAEAAGIKVPSDPDGEYNPDDFPHFEVFCNVTVGVNTTWDLIRNNAKVISLVSDGDIKKITLNQLHKLGVLTND